MSSATDYAMLGRTEAAHVRAKRLMRLADRAQNVGVKFSILRSTTSCRAFGCLAEFFAATERWDRAACRRFALARRLRADAYSLLVYGVAS